MGAFRLPRRPAQLAAGADAGRGGRDLRGRPQPYLSVQQGLGNWHRDKIAKSLAALVRGRREQQVEVWMNIGEEMLAWCRSLYKAYASEEQAAGAGLRPGTGTGRIMLPIGDAPPPQRAAGAGRAGAAAAAAGRLIRSERRRVGAEGGAHCAEAKEAGAGPRGRGLYIYI